MAQPVKVFISYAREDTAFVDSLTEALNKRGIEAWVDRREIPAAADWLRRIVDGIVKATFFIFVVSPESATSEVCAVELRQAVGLNKPLVPLLWRDAEMPEALGSLQWCDFSSADSFEDSVDKLEAALRRDPEWLADHARFAVSASDWDTRGRPWYSLLHGNEIRIAEQWLAQTNDTRPAPTALQIAYVQASRRFSTRWKLTAAGATMILLVIIAVTILLRQRSVREAEARDLAARAVQLRNSDQAALPASTLMLVEAIRQLSDVGVRSPDIEAMLRTGTSMLLRPLGEGTHPNGIGGMAVAPDGKLVATFAFGPNVDVSAWESKIDNTVRVWQVPSNTPASLLPHETAVGAAAFSGNDRLVTGTISGSLAFWNLDQALSGSATPFAKHEEGSPISSIAGSASHAIAVTADNSGKVNAWDTSTGARLWSRSASSKEGQVIVALSPDGKLIASGNEDGQVQIWAVREGNPLQSKQHASRSRITALAFSPGSNQIASGDEEGELHFWSPDEGTDQFALQHRDEVTEIAYTSLASKSSFIATVSKDGSLRLIDPIAFGPWRITEFRFDYALWRLALDPSGSLAAVARGDGFVDLWGRDEGRVVGRMRISTGNVATGLAFLPGNVLAVVDGGQGVQFAEVTAGRDYEVLNAPEDIDQMAVSKTGLLLASDFYGNGRAWDLSGTTAKPNPLESSSFTHVAINSVGDRAALIDERAKMLRIVALPDGSEITHWPIPENIGAVAWNPKQDVVAVAKRDGGTWVYDTNGGREITHTTTGGMLLSFSPDGSQIAIVVPGEGLRIWEWNSGAEPWMPDGTAEVVTAAFSSEALLMASKERVVRATRIPSSGKVANPLQQIWTAEFCPGDMQLAVSSDGTLLATACEDGRIRMWSALTGTIASELLYPNQPEALAFTAEGRLLIVGGKNGLRSFLVSGDDLVAEACRRLQRNFSQAEWARYVGVGRCRSICAGKPGCE